MAQKPHAVCVPFPTQGHLNPLLKLAKLLHHKGFHITFVNTEYNHKRLLKSKGANSLNGLPDFRFETIPDGLPELTDNTDATQDIPTLCDSTRKNFIGPFRQLLEKINHTCCSNVPPVTCIISDTVFTFQASEELGIPNIQFWTTSACGFLGYKKCADLLEQGVTPFKDPDYLTNGHLDTKVEWIPGKDHMRLRDIPSFIRTTDPSDLMLDFIKGEIYETLSRASAIILVTFDALEHDVLDYLSTIFPPIYTLGPIHLLPDEHISEKNLKSLELNLWKEEDECIVWLDSKAPNSVIYVNFGSIMVMTPNQVLELAWGLANSKQNFLWIIRGDLVIGDSATLPQEFIDETKGRCKLASWCPQQQVLNHPSVGGFLTHNGWNSTLESISSGVPMICWPFFSEQMTNCRYACMEWGIGLELNEAKRDEVEKLVRELMEGENGKKMRKKGLEWKAKAKEATSPGGSSSLNLEKLVTEALLPRN